jgi:Mce-associated membrane protein
MATDQKSTDPGPWFADAVDEDVPAPVPELLKEHTERKPASAWIAIALGVLIIGFLAESVFLFRSHAPERDRTDVLGISRRFVVALTTYDSSTLPGQRTTVLSMSSGQFRSDFDKLTSNPAFASALSTARATSSGKIVNLAVASATDGNATVLGVVDVTVTNKDLKVPRVDRQVIQMTLVHTSSGWKVDSVTVLGKLS